MHQYVCVYHPMYLCVFDEAIRRTGGRLPGGGKDPADRLKRPINTPLAHLQPTNNTLVVGIAKHTLSTSVAGQDVMIICGG